MFLSGFTLSHEINTCPRTTICKYFEQITLSGDILNVSRNVKEQKDYEFTRSLKKYIYIYIYI